MDNTEKRLIEKRLLSLRILYVEDNAIVREVTSELLAHPEREIVACGSAEEALREFSSRSFDVVITDVSLPVMSGVEFARAILRIQPQMPVIIASGYSMDFGLENWGANVRTITKPFEVPDLEAMLREIFRG
jgi:CheY-like chemotaxis protein